MTVYEGGKPEGPVSDFAEVDRCEEEEIGLRCIVYVKVEDSSSGKKKGGAVFSFRGTDLSQGMQGAQGNMK